MTAPPVTTLPPWLSISPLAGVSHFLSGFGHGEQAASAQASREQQASQFGEELALRQARAQQDYQIAEREQKARQTQALATALWHQAQLAETLKQHQAQRAQNEALNQYRQKKLAVMEPKPIPTSVTAIPIVNPDGTPNSDLVATPSATGRGVVVHPLKKTKEGALTDTQKAQLRQLDIAEREVRSPNFLGDRDAELAKLNAARETVYGKVKPAAAPSAPAAPAAPKRIRVKEKKTGKLGWWEGTDLPADYEIVPTE